MDCYNHIKRIFNEYFELNVGGGFRTLLLKNAMLDTFNSYLVDTRTLISLLMDFSLWKMKVTLWNFMDCTKVIFFRRRSHACVGLRFVLSRGGTAIVATLRAVVR